MANELHNLLNELEKFCVDNGIDKSKTGYLMGLFTKHRKVLISDNIPGRGELFKCSVCCDTKVKDNGDYCSECEESSN